MGPGWQKVGGLFDHPPHGVLRSRRDALGLIQVQGVVGVCHGRFTFRLALGEKRVGIILFPGGPVFSGFP